MNNNVFPQTLSVPIREAKSFLGPSSMKTVSSEKRIMSQDQYPSIRSHQMEADFVYYSSNSYAKRAVLDE